MSAIWRGGFLRRLPYDPFLRGKVTLDPVSWDDPAAPTPMVATLTPQEAVNHFGCRPSECDIVIVVLWSRLGTNLELSKFQKPNGEPYLSGTEYEYEEAVNAEHPPEILVYRRTEKFRISVDDPAFDDKREQYRKTRTFFDRFKNPDGSYRGGFSDYATPTDFVSRLGKDLKTIIQKRLTERASSSRPVRVFLSYSHKDQSLVDEFQTHLKSLQRIGAITNWSDRCIASGADWHREISTALEEADLVLILISPDFLASDYAFDIEVKRAIQKHEEGKARVCDFSKDRGAKDLRLFLENGYPLH